MSLTRTSRVSVRLTKEAWDPPTKKEVTKFLKGVGVYAAGAGVGSAVGYAFRKKVLPRLAKELTNTERAILSTALGAGSGLASSAAFKRLTERSDAERRKR
jgi:hypothetical protein